MGIGRLNLISQVPQTSKADDEHEDFQKEAEAWDDVTGEPLEAKEVRAARQKEMVYIAGKRVYRRVKRTMAARNGWKTIKTRWLDINEGNKLNPNYRSRFVGKEFNDGVQEGLFAGTPPLEALRLIISHVATRKGYRSAPRFVMINDAARAFFEADMKRYVCIELPAEEGAPEDEVGLLLKSLYGTRDASANFQELVKEVLVKAGFKRSRYNPALYHHK